MGDGHHHGHKDSFGSKDISKAILLVFRSEAILPLEIQLHSLRVALRESLTEEENVQVRLDELESLDEKRLEALQSLEIYQQRMENAFNRKIRLHSFKKGNLVHTPI